jgi:methionyl aminopeptidase
VIQLKSAREIDLMAQGGRILGATLDTLRAAVRPGISTGELDQIAEDFIRSHDGAVPAFTIGTIAIVSPGTNFSRRIGLP